MWCFPVHTWHHPEQSRPMHSRAAHYLPPPHKESILKPTLTFPTTELYHRHCLMDWNSLNFVDISTIFNLLIFTYTSFYSSLSTKRLWKVVLVSEVPIDTLPAAFLSLGPKKRWGSIGNDMLYSLRGPTQTTSDLGFLLLALPEPFLYGSALESYSRVSDTKPPSSVEWICRLVENRPELLISNPWAHFFTVLPPRSLTELWQPQFWGL